MSRIGRMPIAVPSGVEVSVKGQDIIIKGAKGELSLVVSRPIEVEVESDEIKVKCPDQERLSRSLHGLTRTLISNMVEGVTQGFRKELEIVGTGYRVQARGNDLEFALGYSHPVTVKAPEGITFVVKDQNKVSVEGIDKQKVGEAAVNIRNLRKPDPYKGKGIRYAGEHIRRKVGKAGK